MPVKNLNGPTRHIFYPVVPPAPYGFAWKATGFPLHNEKAGEDTRRRQCASASGRAGRATSPSASGTPARTSSSDGGSTQTPDRPRAAVDLIFISADGLPQDRHRVAMQLLVRREQDQSAGQGLAD